MPSFSVSRWSGASLLSFARYIKIGDKECEYNPSFRLILHTKLASPHYQPELQAQCTLIDFTVTRAGLEDQLLAAVVSMERPDLEQLKVRKSLEYQWRQKDELPDARCHRNVKVNLLSEQTTIP